MWEVRNVMLFCFAVLFVRSDFYFGIRTTKRSIMLYVIGWIHLIAG